MKTSFRFPVIWWLGLIVLCFAVATAGTRRPWEKDDSMKLFSKATVRFEDKLSDDQLKSFQRTAGTSKVDKVAASEVVYKFAVASDTRSSVEISTSKGNGAVIRYQTLGQRMRKETPTTAKQLTASTERMLIGRYHIWSLRNDQITSDPDSEFEIVSEIEKVTLQEK